MSYSKEELIEYRMERAWESLTDAEILVNEQRWKSAANRMYYACFYAISAYLAFQGIRATTHSGLKSAFNQELIKPGKIAKAEGILDLLRGVSEAGKKSHFLSTRRLFVGV